MPEGRPHMDAQSAAFREAGPADRVRDHDIHHHAEAQHAPLGDLGEIQLPEDYEAGRWDAGRVGPKSLDDARAQLAARIDDPSAPDGAEVAGAYDDLEDGDR